MPKIDENVRRQCIALDRCGVREAGVTYRGFRIIVSKIMDANGKWKWVANFWTEGTHRNLDRSARCLTPSRARSDAMWLIDDKLAFQAKEGA